MATPAIFSGAFAPRTVLEADGLGSIEGLTQFEATVGKGVAVVEGYQHWGDPDPAFPTAWMDQVRAHGSIPYLGWESRVGGLAGGDGTPAGNPNQPDFALKQIYVAQRYDAYIHQWAHDAAAWGHSFFLRLNAEMNANRQPFSALMNGNQIADYARTWDYVRAIFTQEGANNVTWVWCPTVYYPHPGFVPLAHLWMLYPGADQVDWIGINGYNYGQQHTPLLTSPWQSFAQIFGPTYAAIHAFAPGKPLIIEMGSAEQGGSKAAWITDAYTTQIPHTYPQVRAVVWFNYNNALLADDNTITSSPEALAAFRAAVAAPIYAANAYGALSATPISPLAPIAP